jgi:hypothetical protein
MLSFGQLCDFIQIYLPLSQAYGNDHGVFAVIDADDTAGLAEALDVNSVVGL